MTDASFNPDAVRIPHVRQQPSGGATSMAAGGRSIEEIHARERELIAKGKTCPDWWSDIGAGSHMPKNERVGYPTQKPLALLDRIIKASSNPGDVVLDPFCGCATACVSAESFGAVGSGSIYRRSPRRWSLSACATSSRCSRRSTIGRMSRGAPT